MKIHRCLILGLLVVLMVMVGVAGATVLFDDDFNDVDISDWTVSSGTWSAVGSDLNITTGATPSKIYRNFTTITNTSAFNFSVSYINSSSISDKNVYIKFYVSDPSNTTSPKMQIWISGIIFRLQGDSTNVIVGNAANITAINDGTTHILNVSFNGINSWSLYRDTILVGTGTYTPTYSSNGIQLYASDFSIKNVHFDNILYWDSSSIDVVNPTYSDIDINQTISAASTNFSITYTDETVLQNNGQWRFGTNNSGTWEYSAWTNFTSTPQTIYNITTLNSTIGAMVGYNFSAKDNAGNYNNTSIYTVTTTSQEYTETGCNYFISPTGDNANTGLSIAQAWKNLSWTVASSGLIVAGTKTCLLNGTYTDTAMIDFETKSNGNVTHPIQIVAYNGTAIITGGTDYEIVSPDNAYGMQLYGNAYIQFKNISLSHYWTILRTYNSNHITFTNMTYQYSEDGGVGNNSNLVNYQGCSNCTMSGNNFYSPAGYTALNIMQDSNNSIFDTLYFNGIDGHPNIQVNENTYNVTIDNVTIENSTMQGIIFYKTDTLANGKAGTNVFDINNISINTNTTEAFEFWSSKNGMVKNVTILNTAAAGSPISLTSRTESDKNENITFYDTNINATKYIRVDNAENITFIRTNISNLPDVPQWRLAYSSTTYPANNITIQDEIESSFTGRMRGNSTLAIYYSAGTVFTRTTDAGSATIVEPKYYPSGSNSTASHITGSDYDWTITKYNLSILPSTASLIATNNTTALNLNYTSNPIPTTNITLGTGESKKINLAGLTGTNYTLEYQNGTDIEVLPASGGIVNFTTTLGEGSYSIQEESSPFTPSYNTINCPVGWCYLAMNYTNKTLLELDNMFTTDIVQGWYNASTQKFESHSTYSSNQNVNVTQKSGYYYYFRTPTTVNVNITANPSITLKSGWNLVGNMDTNRTLSDLETSIGGTVVTSSHWNNTNQQWKNPSDEVVPVGEPFMVYVNADTVWVG